MVWSNKLLLASGVSDLIGYPDSTNGGFRAFNNFGDGLLYNLNVAAKSTETSAQWYGAASGILGDFSRMNGSIATEANSSSDIPALLYAKNLSFGGQTDWYLGAIDELRAISSKLKPSAATQVAFQSGGSEVFDSGVASNGHWSSTELTSSSANGFNMVGGFSEFTLPKSISTSVRPIRRFATTMPYPIGTAMQGGYLAAYFTDLSTGSPLTYMLIVADKTTETSKPWATGLYATTSRTNGLTNTNSISTNSADASGYCYNLVSGSQTDWYLGAIDEMLSIASMNSSLPGGQQMDTVNFYKTSTEIDTTTAKVLTVSGGENTDNKSTTRLVRPIRRVLLP